MAGGGKEKEGEKEKEKGEGKGKGEGKKEGQKGSGIGAEACYPQDAGPPPGAVSPADGARTHEAVRLQECPSGSSTGKGRDQHGTGGGSGEYQDHRQCGRGAGSDLGTAADHHAG